MKKESEVTTGGISFSGVLLIVFVVLKLIGVINWSWWWVLSPFLDSFFYCTCYFTNYFYFKYYWNN